ncbi:hypothetical protein OIK40_00460 [Erythrobacter sp. sf7]|uniref:Lasso RiPP family leader peptide-containing protein n=1 Tax=Erythrobacter fulvus TaxID=2987523 RepID=A0ABT5JKU2_9SPHN|nr:hypothetical protein [Erythrobacter fulvus]
MQNEHHKGAKHAYATPVLSVYGSVRQLTGGSNGPHGDGGGSKRAGTGPK